MIDQQTSEYENAIISHRFTLSTGTITDKAIVTNPDSSEPKTLVISPDEEGESIQIFSFVDVGQSEASANSNLGSIVLKQLLLNSINKSVLENGVPETKECISGIVQSLYTGLHDQIVKILEISPAEAMNLISNILNIPVMGTIITPNVTVSFVNNGILYKDGGSHDCTRNYGQPNVDNAFVIMSQETYSLSELALTFPKGPNGEVLVLKGVSE